MILEEWKEKYHIPYHTGRGGSIGFHDGKIPPEARAELFHLSDYQVSGVFAGCIWLWKRIKKEVV